MNTESPSLLLVKKAYLIFKLHVREDPEILCVLCYNTGQWWPVDLTFFCTDINVAFTRSSLGERDRFKWAEIKQVKMQLDVEVSPPANSKGSSSPIIYSKTLFHHKFLICPLEMLDQISWP